jgi:hypothetical protein
MRLLCGVSTPSQKPCRILYRDLLEGDAAKTSLRFPTGNPKASELANRPDSKGVQGPRHQTSEECSMSLVAVRERESRRGRNALGAASPLPRRGRLTAIAVRITLCITCEPTWRGPCASTDRDRLDRQVHARVSPRPQSLLPTPLGEVSCTVKKRQDSNLGRCHFVEEPIPTYEHFSNRRVVLLRNDSTALGHGR